MSEALERAKGRTLKEIAAILRMAYRYRGSNPNLGSWSMTRISKDYCKDAAEREKEVQELFNWGVLNPDELEVYVAGRSPGSVASWSVSHNRRLCKEAEDIVKEKAKGRSTLLDYCSHFGILLDDVSSITMKAAFGDKSHREKAYIRKIEHTKGKIKEFVSQMVANGDLDPSITVKELMETL